MAEKARNGGFLFWRLHLHARGAALIPGWAIVLLFVACFDDIFFKAMPLSTDVPSGTRNYTRSVRFDGHAVRRCCPRWRREAKTGTD